MGCLPATITTLKAIIGLRVSQDEENIGLVLTRNGEKGYSSPSEGSDALFSEGASRKSARDSCTTCLKV